MKTYTVEDILALHPCKTYAKDDGALIRILWGGCEGLTAREIGALEIHPPDRVWCLIRLLDSDATRRLWACDVAEAVWLRHGAPKFPDERRPIVAIEVARRFARGEASQIELRAAHADAADAADAAYAAYAACAAAYAAAYAAYAPACDAACDAYAAACAAASAARLAHIASLVRLVEAGRYLPPEVSDA